MSRVLSVLASPFTYFFSGNSNQKDLIKERDSYLEAPFENIPKKQITNGFASKEFTGTVKVANGDKEQERYLESHVRKGKDFTVVLTGIADAIDIDTGFTHKSVYEKGEYTVTKNDLPLSANTLDGYVLNITANGKKAGYLIGADQSGLGTVKKLLDDISRKLAIGDSLEKTVTWLRDESDYTSRGSTNHPGRLILIN